MHVLKSDLYDTQGGTTAEATHCGVMGGTLDILFKSFAGVSIYKDSLHIKPALPKHWHRLSFKIILKKNLFSIDITGNNIKIRHIRKAAEQINIEVGEQTYSMSDKDNLIIHYAKKAL